jgi:L-alanine-DL-glutamate epimerase-like enolase superfamily enzyme
MRITDIDTMLLKVRLENEIADSINRVSYIGLPLVKISTDDGLEGWGYSWNTAGGSEFAKELLDRYMAQSLLGKDPLRRKQLVHQLFFVENFGWDFRLGRNGLAVMAASMVDMALWDLLCKHAGLPLWKVLGGFHDRIEAYDTHGGWLSWTTEELVSNAKKKVGVEGFRAIKVKVGSPDPEVDYERLKAVRDAIGSSTKLMVDANTKWDLETALRWCRRCRDLDLYWLEEPLNPLDIRGHAILRSKVDIPIAVGESLHNIYAFRDYIEQGAADILQADSTKVAGITEWLEVANLAEAFNLNVYPHTNIQQPLHVQLAASCRNSFVVEHVPWLLDVWKHPLVPRQGYFELPESPGAGTEVRADALEKYAVR